MIILKMMLTMMLMQLSAEQVWSWLAASISVKLCLPHREETCTFQQNRDEDDYTGLSIHSRGETEVLCHIPEDVKKWESDVGGR